MGPGLGRDRKQQRTALGAALALSAGLWAALSLVSEGCVIPDRSFALAETETETAVCEQYCEMVEQKCAGSSAVYTDRSQCRAVCEALPPGNPGDEGGNTVACRLTWLNIPGFEANDCSDVGPAGNGQCGNNCEAFCALRAVACAEDTETNLESTNPGFCEESCEQLTTVGAYSVSAGPDGVRAYDNADTLQCRLGHLTLALTTRDDAQGECTSSRIVPSNQLGPCRDGIGAISAEEDRQTYCRLVQHACDGDQAVYESPEQCELVSETFVIGTAEDTAANTLRCRRYHAYNSFVDPGTHCTHAGPTGDGTCAVPAEMQEGNCVSYCRILRAACQNRFEIRFTGVDEDALESCVEDCTALPDSGARGFLNPRYSATNQLPPETLKCRTQRAVRALDVRDGPDCAAAFGEAGTACDPGTIATPL